MRPDSMRRAAFLAVLVLAACEPSAPKPIPPVPTTPPALPPLPEITIARPDWADRTEGTELPPGGEVRLRWGFAAPRRLACDYAEKSQLVSVAEIQNQRFVQRAEAGLDGYVEIVSDGGGRAELRYRRTLRSQKVDGHDVPSEKINEEKPLLFQCLITDDGRFESTRRVQGQAEKHLIDILMGLPKEALAPGGTSTLQFHFGENVQDFGHHGTATLKHAGRVKVGRHECVRLRSEIDLEVTPPRTMEAIGRMKGVATSYFDPEAGCFVAVDAALSMVIHTRAMVALPNRTDVTVMSLGKTVSDTQISIRIKE